MLFQIAMLKLFQFHTLQVIRATGFHEGPSINDVTLISRVLEPLSLVSFGDDLQY